jgi:hypothetical protein
MSGTQIPLAAQAPQPNIGAVLGQANAFTNLQANQQALAGTQALKAILGNPQNLDPAGTPKPNVMAQIAAADPDAWMKVRASMQDTSVRQAQLQKYALDRHLELQETVEPVRVAALDAYKKARDAGADEATAQAAGQAVYGPMLDELKGSGVLSDQEKVQLSPRFDPQRAWANSDKWQAIQKQRDAEADRQRELDIQERSAGRKTYGTPQQVEYRDEKGQTQHVLAQQGPDGGWVTADQERRPLPAGVMTAKQPLPGSVAADRQAIAEDLETDAQWKDKKPSERAAEVERQVAVVGGKLVDPAAKHVMAQAIAGYQEAPLTGYAMSRPGSAGPDVMAEVFKINPDYQAARYPEVNRAMSEFGSGKLGSITRSMNVGIQHLDSIDALGKALQNGDVRLINSVAQAVKTELGVPAPVTFDAAKQIVADEIVKAIVGYSGAVNDRESMQEKLNKANSPEQLLAVTKEFRTLMAGQLQGLRKQYEDATGFKSGPFAFDNKLMPATKRELGVVDSAESGADKGGGLAVAPADKGIPSITNDQAGRDAFAKLAPGARFVTPNGEVRTKSGTPAPTTTPATTAPTRPANVPPGSMYSPSRKAWRTPDGQIIPAGQ